MKYMICETKKIYHCVEVSEEVNMEELMDEIESVLHKYDSGCEAITVILERVKDTYGLEYEIKCGYCGTEIDGLSIVDEVE